MRLPVSRRALLRQAFRVTVIVGVVPLLEACSANAPAPGSGQPATAGNPTSAAAAATVAPAAGQTDLGLVYLNQSRGQAKALESLAEKYSAQTSVKVTIDSPGPTDYPKKLQAASQVGNMPDTFYAIGAADMAPYYKAGWALNLVPELEKGWKSSFSPAAIKLSTWSDGNPAGVPAGVYSVPWELSSYAVLYNPAHFQKAGLDPKQAPATMPEFIDSLKKIKAAGIGPFLFAAEFVPQFVQAYASNWLTDEEIEATHAGKASWKVDGWRRALQLILDLREAGALFNDALPTGDVTNPTMEKSFFNVRELACFYTGTFSVGVQRTTAPDFTDFASFPLPKAADAKLDPRAIGGPGKSGVVNAKGPRVADSLAFVKWLTDVPQAEFFMNEVPLVPSNPGALDPKKVSPQIAGFAALVDKIQIVPTSTTASVNDALIKGAQSIVLKEKTVDQVLDEVDTAQRSG
ncbi:MAG: ABC transporter substrate-binding protein [Chloroflexota bacterium]